MEKYIIEAEGHGGADECIENTNLYLIRCVSVGNKHLYLIRCVSLGNKRLYLIRWVSVGNKHLYLIRWVSVGKEIIINGGFNLFFLIFWELN